MCSDGPPGAAARARVAFSSSGSDLDLARERFEILARVECAGRSPLRAEICRAARQRPRVSARVLLSVTAAPAMAADVAYDSGGMTIKGAGEASKLTVRFDRTSRRPRRQRPAARPRLPRHGSRRHVRAARAARLPCSAWIDLGDGNDTLVLSGSSQRGPFLVDAARATTTSTPSGTRAPSSRAARGVASIASLPGPATTGSPARPRMR